MLLWRLRSHGVEPVMSATPGPLCPLPSLPCCSVPEWAPDRLQLPGGLFQVLPPGGSSNQ